MKLIPINDAVEEPTSHNPKVKKRVFIKDRQLPHLVYYSRVEVKSGQIMTEHKHDDMFEVFVVQSGDGIFKINGKVFPIKSNTCFVVEPGEQHELLNTGSNDLVLLYFGLKS